MNVLPALRYAHEGLAARKEELGDVVKTGRTHLMDAMPIRMDQVISGWMAQIGDGIARLESTLPRVLRLRWRVAMVWSCLPPSDAW